MQGLRRAVYGAHVLTIHSSRLHSESLCAHRDVAGGRFRVVRIFRVEVIFAYVDHGKFVELGEVHDLIQDALSQSAFSEEADRYLSSAETLRRERRSSRDPCAAADNCIRTQ